MGLRDRRCGDSKRTFCMREKVFAIGDDYWIEDADGQKVYKADGKAIAVRDTMMIEIGGREAKVKKRLIGIRDRYNVDFDEGDQEVTLISAVTVCIDAMSHDLAA